MTDAYKHLRKKGMSYKDKKDFLKSIPKTAFAIPYPCSSALTVANLNDDVDLSALSFAFSHVLAVTLIVHHLKNDDKFTKFLEEIRKENQE